ncbi:MAG: HD-GYP domain-containing protein [Candidatus Humimicrobiia bacterium]
MPEKISKITIYYVISTFITGLFLLIYITLNYRNFSISGILYFGFLIVLSIFFEAPLIKGGKVSILSGLSLTCLLIYGPTTASWVMLTTLFNIREWLEKTPWYKFMFNIGQLLISIGLSGIIYKSINPTRQIGAIRIDSNHLLTILLSSMVFFITNTLLTAGVIGVSEKINFFSLWIYSYLWLIPFHLILTALAVLVAYLHQIYGSITLLLTIIPLILTQYVYYLRIREKQAFLQNVINLVRVIEAKDKYTAGHSMRVAEYAEKVARKLRLSEFEIELLKNAAYLHDIGKIRTDLSILKKPKKLRLDEWDQIKEHPTIGFEIISDMAIPKSVGLAILYHHEKYDGSGYPGKLEKDKIPLFARILCVVDSFDAMVTTREYKRTFTMEEAAQELRKEAGTHFDPKIVNIFCKILEKEYNMIEVYKPEEITAGEEIIKNVNINRDMLENFKGETWKKIISLRKKKRK